jgi:hypothetical protein
MACASILSIDTGKSRLSSATRVAVTTTEVSSPELSPANPAALSPSAVPGAAINHGNRATLPIAIPPRFIKKSSPLAFASCLAEHHFSQSLKYGR